MAKKFAPCGAKTNAGTPCKLAGSGTGGRCRVHGGASPTGPACPSWKHGGFSKYLQPEEAQLFSEFKETCGLGQDVISDEEELQLFRLVSALCGPGYVAPDKRAVMLDLIGSIRLKYQKLRGGEKPQDVNVNLNARDDLVSRIAGIAARRQEAGGVGEPDGGAGP